MPDPVSRGPAENAGRVILGDPVAQQFARLVPVDQEHQRRADGGEERIPFLGRRRLILPGHQIEVSIVAETIRRVTIEAAPFGGEVLEQTDKEFGARPVDVGVGDGDRIVLNGDHQNMGIGGSDVVLDQQPVARSRRHRIETRMVELQRAGLLKPPHETFDGTMIVRTQAEHARACNRLFSAARRQPVERLVQVHHQTMQAVAVVVRYASQLADPGYFDFARRFQRAGGLNGREARRHGVTRRRVAGCHGADHRRHIVKHVLH